MNAVRVEPDAVNILLVDAEARVEAGVFAHLTGWQFKGCVEATVHLMARTMEAWIVADRDAMQVSCLK